MNALFKGVQEPHRSPTAGALIFRSYQHRLVTPTTLQSALSLSLAILAEVQLPLLYERTLLH